MRSGAAGGAYKVELVLVLLVDVVLLELLESRSKRAPGVGRCSRPDVDGAERRDRGDHGSSGMPLREEGRTRQSRQRRERRGDENEPSRPPAALSDLPGSCVAFPLLCPRCRRRARTCGQRLRKEGRGKGSTAASTSSIAPGSGLTRCHELPVAREANSVPWRPVDKILEAMKRRDLELLVRVRDGEDADGSVGGVDDETPVETEQSSKRRSGYLVIREKSKAENAERLTVRNGQTPSRERTSSRSLSGPRP